MRSETSRVLQVLVTLKGLKIVYSFVLEGSWYSKNPTVPQMNHQSVHPRTSVLFNLNLGLRWWFSQHSERKGRMTNQSQRNGQVTSIITMHRMIPTTFLIYFLSSFFKSWPDSTSPYDPNRHGRTLSVTTCREGLRRKPRPSNFGRVSPRKYEVVNRSRRLVSLIILNIVDSNVRG